MKQVYIEGIGNCVTSLEAAAQLGITHQAVSFAVKNKKIESHVFGSMRLIPVTELDRYRRDSLRQPGRKSSKKDKTVKDKRQK